MVSNLIIATTHKRKEFSYSPTIPFIIVYRSVIIPNSVVFIIMS